MRALYCEATCDINLILEEGELKELRRSQYATPVLSAESKRRTFCLMNPSSANKVPGQIDVKEPRQSDDSCQTYFIRIGDEALQTLMRDGRVGTRRAGGSKVNVILEQALDKYQN